MRFRVAGLALLACGSAAAARFDPPDGHWRYLLTETRAGSRFVSERRLVIRHDPAGIVAEITQDGVRSDGPAAATGAMFAAGMAGFTGRTIRFHIAPDGTVTAIDDLESLWSGICDAIDAMATGPAALGGARRTTVRSLSAPLRALPPGRRRAILASILRPVVVAQVPEVGDRPVHLPMATPTDDTLDIAARETVQREADGTVRIDTHAAGTPAGVPPATLDYDLSRSVDPRSGLVLRSRETVRWTTGQGTVTTVTTIQLTPMVS